MQNNSSIKEEKEETKMNIKENEFKSVEIIK